MQQIKIPVKPHVKQFLEVKYGDNYKLTKTTFLGVLLIELLNDDIVKQKDLESGTAYFVINIPDLYYNKYGFNVTLAKKRLIGICLEKIFKEFFHEFIDLELYSGKDAYPSIVLFREYYNITETDFKLETMYRGYQRYSRESIKQKKKNNSIKKV